MEDIFDIWNEPKRLAEEAYQLDNFIIEEHSHGNGICVIYCSSNNIWYPHTKEIFQRSILTKNYFEWRKIRYRGASKEIFIRDIFKSWYVTGINCKIDSIDKLVDFLKEECKGYEIVLIGSSAGGYLAALLSALLPVKHAVVFSAQFELRNKWAYELNPFLRKYDQDTNRSKYYDLKNILEYSNTPIYYIVPKKSDDDSYQLEHIKDVKCIRPLIFNSKHHGVVLLKDNLEILISKSKEDLENIYTSNVGKILNPIAFSFQLVGVRKTVKALINETLRLTRRVKVKILNNTK